MNFSTNELKEYIEENNNCLLAKDFVNTIMYYKYKKNLIHHENSDIWHLKIGEDSYIHFIVICNESDLEMHRSYC